MQSDSHSTFCASVCHNIVDSEGAWAAAPDVSDCAPTPTTTDNYSTPDTLTGPQRPRRTPCDGAEKRPQAKCLPPPGASTGSCRRGKTPAGDPAPPFCRWLFGSPHSGSAQQGSWQTDFPPAAPKQPGQPAAPPFSRTREGYRLVNVGVRSSAFLGCSDEDPGWPGRDADSYPRELWSAPARNTCRQPGSHRGREAESAQPRWTRKA